MTSPIPNPAEFFQTVHEKSFAMAAFGAAVNGINLDELPEEQAKWITVGIACAIPTTVEELLRRGLLK